MADNYEDSGILKKAEDECSQHQEDGEEGHCTEEPQETEANTDDFNVEGEEAEAADGQDETCFFFNNLVLNEEEPLQQHSTSEEVDSKETVETESETEVDPTMEACFKSFDKDEDNSLNINEFSALLKALFRNEKGRPYPLDVQIVTEIFNIFNKSGDGSMSREEFTFCWNNWIKKIVRPVSCLIIVDVQNDFISGSLAISNCPAGHDGYEVVHPINKLLETVPFDAVCYSLDWHPQDHISFIDNVHNFKLDVTSSIQDPHRVNVYDTVVFEGPPKTEQKMWPAHCVQGSWGSELHKDLKVHPQATIIYKGINTKIDSYSAFFDNKKLGHTELEEVLRRQNITDVFVCGIALDVCVGWTALHAQELGFRTIFIEDCSRGIDPDDIKMTLEKVRADNGVVINSCEAKAMVQGRDRRVELGYKLALECRKQVIYPPKNKNSKYNPVLPGMAENGSTDTTATNATSAVTASA